MEVIKLRCNKSRRQESYILVALVLFLLSYGCGIYSTVSEPALQIDQSSPGLADQPPTEPIVSDALTRATNENSRKAFPSKKALSKEEISQLQARLKAAGFDPGPIDGILGYKTRSVIVRVQAACTILNELSTSATELSVPATESQASALTRSAKSLSKVEIQLLQRRLKAAGFYTGPIDGTLGVRTKTALSQCKSGCAVLDDISEISDKPAFEQAKETPSPVVSAPAEQPASVDNVSSNQEIRRTQERLKAAGFAPGPVDGRMGPQTRSALEKYRSSDKASRSGSDGLVHY